MREANVTCEKCGLTVVVEYHDDGKRRVRLSYPEFVARCQTGEPEPSPFRECPNLAEAIQRASYVQ